MTSIQRYKLADAPRSLKDLWNILLLHRKCSISPIEHLEDGYVWATDWDLELHLPQLSQDVAAVAIPAKAITPGFGENAHRCLVKEVLTKGSSCTVMISPVLVRDASPLMWTLSRKEWEKIQADCISVHIPSHKILALKQR